MLNILNDYKIKHKANNKELTIQLLDNNSYIYVSGAKDKIEIEKFRGMSLHKVYVDEAQSFKAYIRELVEDVLSWACKDVDGTICLTGTPGPYPQGYFYEMSTSTAAEISHHHWTMARNPWIKIKSKKEPEQILAEERARKGITETDPTYMREALGLWTKDEDAIVYKFNANKNITLNFPERLNYIFGIDIGYNDKDAIAVIGYSTTDSNVYLVEEFTARKQSITDLVLQLKEMQSRFKPIKMIMDAGALGKKIQEEIRTRHGINIEAASKERKLEFIELLNDDLRSGRFKTFPNSEFEQDAMQTVWEPESNPKKISDTFHSDIADAVLYGWREARHYIPKDDPILIINKNSNEYMIALEEKEAATMEAKNNGEMDDWGCSDEDLLAVFDAYDGSGFDDY